MMDFESASHKAAKSTWTHARLFGCIFHYKQALWRAASRSPNIASRILIRGSHHNNAIKMFMSLAVLKPRQIRAGLSSIIRYLQAHGIRNDFNQFIIYFDATWKKRYKPTTWCVGGQKHMTNNFLESFNSFLKRKIPRNPNVYTFLKNLNQLAGKVTNEIVHERVHLIQRESRSELKERYEIAYPKLIQGRVTMRKFLYFMSHISNRI
jgi:hypothetical protein